MPLKVAALYQFAALPDFRDLREPLRALAAGLGLKGSVLLAHEGINGTVAGGDEAIDAFVGELQHGALFGGRLDNLELKFSSASGMPFQRLKIRLKKEIVTLGDTAVDPTRTGRHLCRAVRLERTDISARHTGDRYPQRLRGGDGDVRRGGRSRSQKLWAVQGIRRAETRPGEAQEDRDVLHRRHPVREGQRLSRWRKALARSITSRAASCAISRACPKQKAAGAANVSCSTSAWRLDTACGSTR